MISASTALLSGAASELASIRKDEKSCRALRSSRP